MTFGAKRPQWWPRYVRLGDRRPRCGVNSIATLASSARQISSSDQPLVSAVTFVAGSNSSRGIHHWGPLRFPFRLSAIFGSGRRCCGVAIARSIKPPATHSLPRGKPLAIHPKTCPCLATAFRIRRTFAPGLPRSQRYPDFADSIAAARFFAR